MAAVACRAVMLAAFAVCVVLAGCGGGGIAVVGKTRAIAFAHTVNLRDADVPAMATIVASFETKNRPPFSGCTTRVATADQVAAVESPWFLRSKSRSRNRFAVPVPPVEGVHSVVYVMRGSGVASRNVASGRRAGAPECVTGQSVLDAAGAFSGREPRKAGIRGSAIPFPLAGVAGYGLRVQGTFAAAYYHLKQRPAYYEDTFGFAVGPAEIVLHDVGVERPFPAGEERRLLSLLYDRANAHALP
jgi:hypothetical protein